MRSPEREGGRTTHATLWSTDDVARRSSKRSSRRRRRFGIALASSLSLSISLSLSLSIFFDSASSRGRRLSERGVHHRRSRDYRLIHAAGWRSRYCFILRGQKRLTRLAAVVSLCLDVDVGATRVGPAERLKAKVSPYVPGRESLSLMTTTARSIRADGN